MSFSDLTEGKSDGQIAAVVGGLVVGVVMLFVGLFMIAVVENATGITDDFVYTTTSNTTVLIMNNSLENHTYNVGAMAAGSVGTARLTIVMINASSADNWATSGGPIEIRVNTTFIQNISAPTSNTTWTYVSVGGLVLIPNSNIDINFSAAELGQTNITNTTLYYPSSTTPSTFGVIQNDLISTTGTIFSILGLVIIIVALAAAIGSLREFT